MYKGLVLCSALILFCGGCGSQPEWVKHPPQDEGYFYGVGSAEGWQLAESRARQSLAFQVNTVVSGMEEHYGTEESGFFMILKTAVVLEGATVVKREQGKDQTCYVLMSYKKAGLKEKITRLVEEEGSRNEAFEPEKALRILDKELK